MQEYDTVLKNLLQRMNAGMLQQITGFAVTRWHNIELPKTVCPRVDLLGETAEGKFVHIELQSKNDPAMGLRMAEYALAIYDRFKRMPEQMVLYVGKAPVR